MDIQKEDVYMACGGGVISRDFHSVDWLVTNQM